MRYDNRSTRPWRSMHALHAAAIGAWIFCSASMLASCANAQQETLPGELLGPWHSFQEAIRNSDADALAKISHFPIRSNDFGGNIGSADVLKERFKKIFFDQVRTCVADKKPSRISPFPGYILDCNNDNLALGFGFEPFEKEYRFSYIDNANAE